MKKRLLAGAMAVASIAALLAGCGGSGSSQAAGDATANTASAEGQVINIYSWNDEFRTRLEAVYPEVDHTSDDGTVTYLKDGTEIHWVINPNQDGVYQQKLDEALLNQATAAADDKIDIFLSETDYVYKYTDADADVAMPLTDLGIDPDTDLADQYPFTKTTASDQKRRAARLHLAVLPRFACLPARHRQGRLRHRRPRRDRREGQGLGHPQADR